MDERSRSKQDIVDRHLARAWSAFAPAPGLSDQVRARLTSSTAATMGAVSLGVAGNARPPGAWVSLQASGKLGAVAGAGLLGIGLLAGYLIRDARDTPPPVAMSTSSSAEPVVPRLDPVPMPAPPSAAAPAPPPPSRVATAPSARARARTGPSPAARASTRTVTAADRQPGDELALLRRAERAVRGDDSALALALIGELEADYPRSSLLEERRAIELMAQCGAGATDARARAQRFLNEHPRSVYAGRIRAMCPESSDPSAPAR
jgi:hypothetical protein